VKVAGDVLLLMPAALGTRLHSTHLVATKFPASFNPNIWRQIEFGKETVASPKHEPVSSVGNTEATRRMFTLLYFTWRHAGLALGVESSGMALLGLLLLQNRKYRRFPPTVSW
jgi:hypothetical protein